MPQEFLRDVLRTGDASGRARRRLSILPVSIAAHALAATVFVIIPLAAEVEVPPIFSPLKVDSFMPTVPPPSPPPPRDVSEVLRPPTGAPTKAPDSIGDEPKIAAGPDVADALTYMGPPGAGTPVGPGLVGPTVVAPPVTPTPPKIPRVGQGIREPKKLVHVAPEYPEIARRARVEGTVILEAILDATGRVDRVRILRSVPLLDDAAVRAVQQWRYTPTELNGVPVPVLMTITVQFSLQR